MSELTMRGLHAVMGELMDLLADVPGVDDPTAVSWNVGRTLGTPGLRVTHLGGDGPTLLSAAERLLGGELRRDQSASAVVSAGGERTRMTTLHTTHTGVPVRVTAWLPEPSEREELLARLAELDAAEGGSR
ncbi:hypothetical protein [Streptomyces profundus]|uniref:hypothetical protein n=1 Tax=Streptomyces profundus TaxID=2867410 RepID=UPI001D164DDB|nr:hypothetical protein [Streptomyces sp. MA3_2.13]UED85288.1 hypothetical protein K4G22_14695 [Streptomyces sp. MA3_2.13]